MSEDMNGTEDTNGISFMTAINTRYVETCLIPQEVLLLPQSEGKDRTIELIGFEKTFERLIEVNVSDMKISYCGNDCQPIKQVLSQTKSLILSHNLLTDWTELAKIVDNLQTLNELVLSYNKLIVPKKEDLNYESFKDIKTLIIDNMDYDWNDILFCAQMWTNIERLDVWGNRITDLKTPEIPVFKDLQYLSLCNNTIEDWTQVCKLGALPQLKTLNVCDCGLKQIRFDDCNVGQKTKLFPLLESLLLSNNKLNEWLDIAELNKLEKLNNLLIKNNPIFDNEKYDINFNFILSRIEGLKSLNREQITEMLRRDAEIAYLRKLYKDYEKTKESNEQKLNFLAENPRFESILTKFGTPFGTESASKSEIQRKKFLTLNIRNPFDDQMLIEKKIPVSISITNLKTIVRKLFDIDYDYDINLLWTSKDFECLLDKESQNLSFYSIENGDTIVVNIH